MNIIYMLDMSYKVVNVYIEDIMSKWCICICEACKCVKHDSALIMMNECMSMFRSQVMNMVIMWKVCSMSTHTLWIKEWSYEWIGDL